MLTTRPPKLLNAIDEKVLEFVLQKHTNGFSHYQRGDTEEGILSLGPSEGTVEIIQIIKD
jgi:hypothetical protein